MSTRLLIVNLSKQTPVPSSTSALGLSQSSVTVLLDVILRHCSSVLCHPTLKPFLALAALLSNLDRYLRLGAVELERGGKKPPAR